MNNTFNIHRLGMVLCWDLHTYWKKYLGITVGLAIAISFFYIMQLFSIAPSIAFSHGEEFYHRWFVNKLVGLPFAFSIIAFFALSTCIFTNMKNKTNRASFLMLPAKNIEKFVARLLMMGVGGIVTANVACIIADLIQLAFSFYITPGYHTSVTIEALKLLLSVKSGNKFMLALFLKNDIDSICLAWSLVFLFHSLCTLGGTIYRKHPLILTACTGLVMSFIFTFGGMKLAEWGFFDLFPTFDYNDKTTSLCLALFWSGIFLGMAATCYRLSYKIFCRMQIICNKWINL